MVEKLIQDGMVAVLVTRHFGTGWSTLIQEEREKAEGLLFDRELAGLLLAGDLAGVRNLAEQRYGIDARGVDSLGVDWLPVGIRFYVTEHAGAESIHLIQDLRLITT